MNGFDPARLTYGFTLRAIAAACLLLLVYGSVKGVGFLGKIQNMVFYRSVAWIGESSYGIYLWHIALARPPAQKAYAVLSDRFSPDFAFVVGFAVWIVVAVFGGYLFTKAVEAPFLRIRDRRLSGTVPAPDLGNSEPPTGDRSLAGGSGPTDQPAPEAISSEGISTGILRDA